MLWLVLASQFGLPVPSNGHIPDVRGVFSADDFPSYLVGTGSSWTVYTRTTVRPDGTIQGCVAEIGSGNARLDALTCGIILKRARFLPAKWTDGSPAYGVIRLPVNWTITDFEPGPEDLLKIEVPDLELSVNQLPKGAHLIAGVMLQVAADEDGHATTCAEHPPLDKRDPEGRFPQLVPIACQQVTSSLTLTPPVDASGKPVRSVQSVTVHFIVNH